MFEVETAEHPPGTIAQVMQPGLRDRRPPAPAGPGRRRQGRRAPGRAAPAATAARRRMRAPGRGPAGGSIPRPELRRPEARQRGRSSGGRHGRAASTRSCSPIPAASTPRSSCAGCRTTTAARWSPSPPTSARARSSSRRGPRPSSWAPAQIFVEDLREEFVRDFVFPMFRANALYEGSYLLGTSIARPLIAKRLVEIAHRGRAPMRSRTARPARATTRCASSSPPTRSTRGSRSSRPGASGT